MPAGAGMAASVGLVEPRRMDRARAVRPGALGAFIYPFGRGGLSFLKDGRLLAVVQGLGDAPTARQACARAGIGPSELRTYERALARLAETDMLRERVG